MGAGVEYRCFSGVCKNSNCGADEDQEDRNENDDGGNGHFPRLDLLAKIFRCPPDHEAGNEHRDDHKDEHPVES